MTNLFEDHRMFISSIDTSNGGVTILLPNPELFAVHLTVMKKLALKTSQLADVLLFLSTNALSLVNKSWCAFLNQNWVL